MQLQNTFNFFVGTLLLSKSHLPKFVSIAQSWEETMSMSDQGI